MAEAGPGGSPSHSEGGRNDQGRKDEQTSDEEGSKVHETLSSLVNKEQGQVQIRFSDEGSSEYKGSKVPGYTREPSKVQEQPVAGGLRDEENNGKAVNKDRSSVGSGLVSSGLDLRRGALSHEHPAQLSSKGSLQ